MKLSIFTSLFALAASASSQSVLTSEQEPQAPALEYLYTAYVDCLNTLYETQGPRGIRKAIPIVGGNFTGPKMSGTILNLGADWGVVDVQTGIFSADTRYNLLTDDGANLWLRTSGSGVPGGELHLRIVIETGDKRYYWLNNAVVVGVLQAVERSDMGSVLKIDAWKMAGGYENTTFINGTTY